MTGSVKRLGVVPEEISAAYEAFVAGLLYATSRKTFTGPDSPFKPGVEVNLLDIPRAFEIVLPSGVVLRVIVVTQGGTS